MPPATRCWGCLASALLWGLVGSENARFARFLRSPIAALRHLARLFRREPDTETTHNPAGGWMALLLMLMLAVQAVSGLFANHDVGFTYSQHGPLAVVVSEVTSEWVTSLHVKFVNWLLIAVALHVLAVLAYRLLKGQDLTGPMVTGSKSLPMGVTKPPRHGHPVLALALAAAAALGVWAVTRLGGGA
jgi:cytochrome b